MINKYEFWRNKDKDTVPIVGMSPGNSYFDDSNVRFLLKEMVRRFERAIVFIPDVPAINTFLGMGYPLNRAKSKAMLKGNNLKNRTLRVMEELDLSDQQIHIVDWENEFQNNNEFETYIKAIHDIYNSSTELQKDVFDATSAVLIHSGKEISDLSQGVDIAKEYLLAEIAFSEYAPTFYNASTLISIYHKPWPVFEKYIAGIYDGTPRDSLRFEVVKNLDSGN